MRSGWGKGTSLRVDRLRFTRWLMVGSRGADAPPCALSKRQVVNGQTLGRSVNISQATVVHGAHDEDVGFWQILAGILQCILQLMSVKLVFSLTGAGDADTGAGDAGAADTVGRWSRADVGYTRAAMIVAAQTPIITPAARKLQSSFYNYGLQIVPTDSLKSRRTRLTRQMYGRTLIWPPLPDQANCAWSRLTGVSPGSAGWSYWSWSNSRGGRMGT